MTVEYNTEKTAALIREAQEITRHLKGEVEGLTQQVARVLDGGEDERVNVAGRQKFGHGAVVVEGVKPKAKSSWLFWR
jgi:hypothetical protein